MAAAPLWTGWWADLVELIDDRTSALGITGAIATVSLYLGFGRDYGYAGLIIAPVMIVLLLLAIAPALGWAFSSRLQRSPGGLIGFGPSVFATVGGAVAITRVAAGDEASVWWKALASVVPAGIAALAVASRGVGSRTLRRDPLAFATVLVASLCAPFLFALAGGWGVEMSHRARGPFVTLGIPVASLLMHLPWAARMVAKQDEAALLPLRVLGRFELVLGVLCLASAGYGVALSSMTSGEIGSATTGDLTYGPEVVLPVLAIVAAMAWHGLRLTRWASSYRVDTDRTQEDA